MTRDEAITLIATTTVLDHDTARRCLEAMPNVPIDRAIRAATEASIVAQHSALDAVEICQLFALDLAAAQIRAEQAIAGMGTCRLGPVNPW